MSTGRRAGIGLALALAAATIGSTTGRAAVTVANGTLGFHIYHPPAALGGTNAEEPSIGADHNTDTDMYQSGLQTFSVKFNDATQPATATWKDVSFALTSSASLDPILFTDSTQGRTFISQLAGLTSLSAFTDNDGGSYTPSTTAFATGFDHQSIGAGPYNPNGIPPAPLAYPHAVFYCSQAAATAGCARSDTGGLSYGNPVPVYSLAQCGGLHGHIRVAPNGLDMLPNQNCDKQVNPGGAGGNFPFQAVVTSNNNGTTWAVQTVPDSHATLRSDPSVAADKANKVFFGYEDAVVSNGTQVAGHAKIATATVGAGGVLTWSPSVDVGQVLGIQNVQFPEVIAGDAGRAAFAFLGSTTSGNPEDKAFAGTWHLYVAITKDGGAGWAVTDVTPNDPVERGCTYLAGNGTCPSSKRNLLDFMDITVEEDGRTAVGYADGCVGACTATSTCQSDVAGAPQVCNTGPTASTSRLASIARLQCGFSLFAEYDTSYACGPPNQVPEAPLASALVLGAGAAVAVPAVLRRRGRHVLEVS